MQDIFDFSIKSKIPKEQHIKFDLTNDEQLEAIYAQLQHTINNTERNAAHYIDANEFAAELINCKLKGELSAKCVKMFKTLISRIQVGWRYKDDDVRQDVASNAMLVILSNWQKYDPTTSLNAFAFFTRTVINGLRQGWNVNATPGIHIPIDSLFNSTNTED